MKAILSLATLIGLIAASSGAWAADSAGKPRNVTFISTSDSHYAAFVNEDRNDRTRDTLRYLNAVTELSWPAALGGERIDAPRGVLLLGDVIDDGDRLFEGKNQSAQQFAHFLADFGLDGADGLLKFPVFETWGNHDGPPVGSEKNGFSFQANLVKRNAARKQKGLISNVSQNGLHYSWDWDDVHFVMLGIYPADKQNANVRYSPVWHDPQGALSFMKEDLAQNVGQSGRPVVLLSHCGVDTDWWIAEDWKAFYDGAKQYNIVAYLYGHSGTGIRQWAPEGETKKWLCINDGQTENGFFVISLDADRLRYAYRCKVWKSEPAAEGNKPKKVWTGEWDWKFTGSAKLERAVTSENRAPRRDYNISPVPFSKVHVDDAFWTPRLETSRKVTIPYAFQQCEKTDRISNFEKAAGLREGKHEGACFNDSDVYKVMEGAAYSLQVKPDGAMRQYLDRLIGVVAAAQWDDGYLFTHYSLPERQPEKRWSNIAWIHEQYCVGHLYEAAVAHYEVTGDDALLKVAKKNADLICRVFNAEGRTDPPGHQQIEIGLCKLYRVTGDEKYLEQAKFFLDQRGRKGRRGPDGNGGLYGTYGQDHIPVVEQHEAVGHSVRAAYMYTGMADVAALTGNMQYVKAIDTIWRDVVGAKLYITGGIGSAGGHEGFGGAYELPNMTAYCETCASIANVLWNHRMFLMHGDGRYIDVLERTLYNAALSGVSLEGDKFFYPNALESIGQHARSPWFGCACCPSNVARFIPSVPGFAYATKDADVYVNLFVGGDATIGGPNGVRLVQKTEYPWQGRVQISVEPRQSREFAIYVRIPGWARGEAVPSDLYAFVGPAEGDVSLKVNGEPAQFEIARGYARLQRTWKTGDTIELNLPMPVRRIVSHANLVTNKGKVALQRGPVVYCLEGPDNDGKVLDLVIPDDAPLSVRPQGDLLGGVVTIAGQARTAKRTLDGRVEPDSTRPFVAIPYYAWAHRGPAQMTVWPARVPEAARPKPAETLTYRSKTTASYVHVMLDAIKDQNVPARSSDSSGLHLDFWPHKGTAEWVQFEWNEAQPLSSMKVYWFDDTGGGECRLPQSWRVLYRDADGQFQPVKNRGPYGTKKDAFNEVEFEPIRTTALKLEISLQPNWSAGVQEVIVQ
jgi:hypothetical protein